ncbi:MAG: BTAD domain-containing putative transcriptional regulator [Nitrospirota bacterium]
MIQSLGRCEILLHGRIIPNEGWRDPKELEVLLALVTLGGQQVPRSELAQLLWPKYGDDERVSKLYAALHRLQETLGRSEPTGSRLITVVGARLSLNATSCWVDCWAFEEAVRQAQRLGVFGQMASAQDRLKEAKALYRGEYLPGCHGLAWVEAKRHALRRQRLWVERQSVGR